MDVPRLLVRARALARLDRRELAVRAGTSDSALSAYERGVRSPTVATLDRLLAACGLQLTGELEPHLAEVDALLDDALGDPQELPSGLEQLAALLDEAEAVWALDAETALSLHGVQLPGHAVHVVATDTTGLRRVLAARCHLPVDRDGREMWTAWTELDLRRVGPQPVYAGAGWLVLRHVDALPEPLRITAFGRSYPVLGLLDVGQAHPRLAEVLARLRERRTVVP